jgi:Cellulose biosynthesis protein BcsN
MRSPLLTALAGGALLLVAGCATTAPSSYRAAELGRWRPVERDAALMRFDASSGSPEVLGVRERRDSERHLRQEIALANATVLPRENRLSVEIKFAPEGFRDLLLAPATPIERHNAATLDRTLRAEFPAAATSVAEAPRSNRFGPYGYASARTSDGISCVYAWQVAEAGPTRLPEGVTAVGLRFRFCDPKQSPNDLLALFEAVSLRFDGARNGSGGTPFLDTLLRPDEEQATIRPAAMREVSPTPEGGDMPIPLAPRDAER